MSYPSGVPDQNAKPSLVAFDSGASITFAVEGNKNYGSIFTQLLDSDGNVISSFSGGTQYTDGGTPPANPVGPTLLWNNTGVWATVGSTAPLPISLYLGTTAVSIGQQAAGSSIPVILPSATITTLTPPSNTGYALDASLTTINTSIGTLLKPASTLTAVTTVSTVTNVSQINGISPTFNSSTFSAKEALDVNPLGTLGTAFTDAGKMNVQGGVATNTAVADKLLNLGAQAISSENSAVTATRMAQLVTDLVGKLIVLPYANPENFVSGRATATDTTSTSLLAAPASGLRNYITQITVWNSSATSTYIKIQDGSGGTELYDIPAPAGGGATLTLPTPLRQPTTATAIFFAANASANAVFVSASGYKGV